MTRPDPHLGKRHDLADINDQLDITVYTLPALFTPGYVFELDTAVFECDRDIAAGQAVTGFELDALENSQEAFNDSVSAAVEHAFLFGSSS